MTGGLRGHPMVQLLLARLREFIRQPEAVFWVYVFPLLMVVALGLAFRSRPMEAIKVDVQQGPAAAEILQTLEENSRFVARIGDQQQCRRRLRTGKAELVVAATQSPGGEPAYEYIFDPTRPGSVLARNAIDDALQRAAGRQDVVSVSDTEVTETGSRYIDFLVPGLIGMGLMGGGLWGVGFAIVDLRIRKLLKRLLATPMKRTHFLAAMMVSRLVFMIPEIVILLAFAALLFHVVTQGSYFIVALLVVLGAFEFAGIGLLVASRARTLEAVSGLMNLVMIPMWIGSGIFFSPDRFPDVLQPAIDVLPLTPLIAALRKVMLEGAGLVAIGGELALIAAWGAGTFLLALKLFRWD